MRTCRPTAGSAPPRLVAWPKRHSQPEFDQHLTTAIHKSPKRYRICCALTNIAQLCVFHTFPPSPKKKETRLHCLPTCQAPGKDYNLLELTPRTFVAHVSLLSSCSNTGQPTITESPLCTWMVLRSGSGIQGNKTTRHRLPPGRTNKPNPTGQTLTVDL